MIIEIILIYCAIPIVAVGLIIWGIVALVKRRRGRSSRSNNTKYVNLCIKREQPYVTKREFYSALAKFCAQFNVRFTRSFNRFTDYNKFEETVKTGVDFVFGMFEKKQVDVYKNFLEQNNVLCEVVSLKSNQEECAYFTNQNNRYYFFKNFIYVNGAFDVKPSDECIVIKSNQNMLSKSEFEERLTKITESANMPIYKSNDFEYCYKGGNEFVLFAHPSHDLIEKVFNEVNRNNINVVIEKCENVNLYLSENARNVYFGKGY